MWDKSKLRKIHHAAQKRLFKTTDPTFTAFALEVANQLELADPRPHVAKLTQI